MDHGSACKGPSQWLPSDNLYVKLIALTSTAAHDAHRNWQSDADVWSVQSRRDLGPFLGLSLKLNAR